MPRPSLIRKAAVAGLIVCASCSADTSALGTEVSRFRAEAPEGAAPGTCWGKVIDPAVIETVTDQVMVEPAETLSDGTLTRPAVYKTETRQAIVKERVETWFETPCDDMLTPEFVASLQRALAARGIYHGSVTGDIDARTRAAIRRFQEPNGLDSGLLSLDTAQKLGLVPIDLPA